MEYILGVTILALLVERYFLERSHAKDREDFVKALLSNNVHDYTDSKQTGEVPEVEEITQPDLEPIEDLVDSKFMEAIHGRQQETN